MEDPLKAKTGIKVTLYSHPLCEAGWSMRQDWIQFYNDCRGLASFRICMAEIPGANSVPTHSKRPQACLAVKAASLQSELAAHLYLDAVQVAAWTSGLDISDLNELLEIARRVGQQCRPAFDFNRFARDITSKPASMALSDDLRKFQINRISVLPTVTFTHAGKGIKLEGKKTYGELAAALTRMAPQSAGHFHRSGSTAPVVLTSKEPPAELGG